MAELLNGLEDFVVPYLDDIAIFSDTWESHIKHMETVLQRIKIAKLTIKPSKCIAGYYQKYINLFSVIAAPLTDALKGRAKKGEIKWTTECENAFRELKGKLIDKPVLYAPNFEREFIVQTDASNAGMGAVLTQLTEQGEEHPILYLTMLAKNFKKYFLDEDSLVASYEWIRDLFQDIPEGLSTSEEEIFIDFRSSEKLKRQFCNKSLFEFGVEVDEELSVLKTKALRILLPFSTSYLFQTGFSAVDALKTKYRSQLNIEK
ncbi:retrovirus-related Pol polyprotein from transposon 17.6 [Trichonephila clavipes]|nr:retrovirus-related Pol polyprotein from transposon 17.6 [Trichonephila clavipes]